MSRVTNSVLLRYGINTFWSSWSFSNKLLNNSLQLNVFFSLFLRNYFFKLLKIQYSRFIITLYIFYLRDQKFSFLDKYLKLNKIIRTNLNLRKNYSLRVSIKDSLPVRKNTSCLRLYKLSIMMFFLLSLVKRIFILKKNTKGIINFFSKVTLNNHLLVLRPHFFFVSKQISLQRVKIKLINSIIKLKFLGLICSVLVFFYTNKRYFVNLKPLTDKKQEFKLPFLFNSTKSVIVKQRLYLVYLSFLFFKASILNFYINILIKEIKDKKHINVIKLLFDNIKVLFEQQMIPIAGIKFQIAGRLNGKLRKSRFGYNIGSIKLMSFLTLCNYSCDFVYTQYGSFSLKLWLCVHTEQSVTS